MVVEGEGGGEERQVRSSPVSKFTAWHTIPVSTMKCLREFVLIGGMNELEECGEEGNGSG